MVFEMVSWGIEIDFCVVFKGLIWVLVFFNDGVVLYVVGIENIVYLWLVVDFVSFDFMIMEMFEFFCNLEEMLNGEW